MQNHIRNTNLRFNLDKDQQRRAWEYLQTMDRQNFKSYSQVSPLHWSIILTATTALRLILSGNKEREELFVKQIVEAVEHSLKQSLPIFLSGLTAGMLERESPHQDALSSS